MGSLQVQQEELTLSKTPSYPYLKDNSLSLFLSVDSCCGWPRENGDVSSIVFLYARLNGDRDTHLGGNEMYTRPPKILSSPREMFSGLRHELGKLRRTIQSMQ